MTSHSKGCRIVAIGRLAKWALFSLAVCTALPHRWNPLNEASAEVFYVDADNGDDVNDGLSPGTAWQTLGKVNSSDFRPGDSALFKRGAVWRGRLRIRSSGQEGSPITFGAFGTGDKPRIIGAEFLTGWTPFRENVWVAPVSTAPYQVFFDGQRGTEESSVDRLDASGEWFWNSGNLYVYSTSSLDVASPKQEIGVSYRDCVFAWDVSHLIIKDIALLRGSYGLYLGGACSDVLCISVESSHNYYDGLMADGEGCSSITFKDCSAHENLRHGIHAHEASNVTVIGGLYYGNAQAYGSGVGFNGVQGGTVSGVHSYNNFYGVKASNGSRQVLIKGNTVHQNLDFGINLDSGTLESSVEGNEVYENGSHGIAVELDSGDCEVMRNLCYRNGSEHAGIFVEMASAVVVCYNIVHDEYIGIRFNERATNCAAYNNVVYNAGGVGFSAFNNCSGITFRNNIAYSCPNLAVHVRDDSQSGFSSDYNNWCVSGDELKWGGESFTFAQWQANTGLDAHSLCSDPQFVAADASDFHVQPTSPCINAGADVGLTQDYEGNQVPQGQTCDIGAFESHGGVRDVVISSISAPGSAFQGETVVITVEAANAGDCPETFDVTVIESPDGVTTGIQTVSDLSPGATVALEFKWEVKAASLGDHTLVATAAAVPGEANLDDNSAQTVVRVHGALPTIYVASIDMSARRAGHSPNVWAMAVVTVVDEAGTPTAGATVCGSWSGAFAGDQSTRTDDAGQATFESRKVRAGGTFTFTVADVVKEGCVYDPDSNVETSDSCSP